MKYSFIFGLLGALLTYWAFLHSGVWLLLLWIAVSFFTLSAGYAGLGPRIFGKRPDGTIPFWIKVIHLPFMLYSGMVWHLAYIIGHENPIDRVSDDLILGRRLRGDEIPDGIVNYVDLTAEFEDPKEARKSANYVSLPILDGYTPSQMVLHSTVSQLLDGTTFVHCAQGHGRTGLFALALLAERGYISDFEKGLMILTKARPRIRLNKTQHTFIVKYLQNFAQQRNTADALNRETDA